MQVVTEWHTIIESTEIYLMVFGFLLANDKDEHNAMHRCHRRLWNGRTKLAGSIDDEHFEMLRHGNSFSDFILL